MTARRSSRSALTRAVPGVATCASARRRGPGLPDRRRVGSRAARGTGAGRRHRTRRRPGAGLSAAARWAFVSRCASRSSMTFRTRCASDGGRSGATTRSTLTAERAQDAVERASFGRLHHGHRSSLPAPGGLRRPQQGRGTAPAKLRRPAHAGKMRSAARNDHTFRLKERSCDAEPATRDPDRTSPSTSGTRTSVARRAPTSG